MFQSCILIPDIYLNTIEWRIVLSRIVLHLGLRVNNDLRSVDNGRFLVDTEGGNCAC